MDHKFKTLQLAEGQSPRYLAQSTQEKSCQYFTCQSGNNGCVSQFFLHTVTPPPPISSGHGLIPLGFGLMLL